MADYVVQLASAAAATASTIVLAYALTRVFHKHKPEVEEEDVKCTQFALCEHHLQGELLYLCLQELDGWEVLAKVRAVSHAWRSQAASVASTSPDWLRSMSFKRLLRGGAPESVLLRALDSDSEHAFEFIQLWANEDNSPRRIDSELDDSLDRAPALMRSTRWWTTRAKAEEMVKTLANLGRENQLSRQDEFTPSCPSTRLPSMVTIATNTDADADWSHARPSKWTWFNWTNGPYTSLRSLLAERMVQAVGFVVSVRVRCVPGALNSAASDFDGRSAALGACRDAAMVAGTLAVLWTHDRRQLIALSVHHLSEPLLLELEYDRARDLRSRHLGDGWVASGADAPVVEISTSRDATAGQTTLDKYCKIMVRQQPGLSVTTYHAGILGDSHEHRFRYANCGEKWHKPLRPPRVICCTGGGVQYACRCTVDSTQ